MAELENGLIPHRQVRTEAVRAALNAPRNPSITLTDTLARKLNLAPVKVIQVESSSPATPRGRI